MAAQRGDTWHMACASRMCHACWLMENVARASSVRAASNGDDSTSKQKIGRRGFQWWCGFSVLDTADCVLDFKWCCGAERVNKNVGPLASAWRCVPPPTMGLAPLLSRLDDDLCNGGLGYWIQTSERGVQRLLRLGREWWHVGSKVVGSNSA